MRRKVHRRVHSALGIMINTRRLCGSQIAVRPLKPSLRAAMSSPLPRPRKAAMDFTVCTRMTLLGLHALACQHGNRIFKVHVTVCLCNCICCFLYNNLLLSLEVSVPERARKATSFSLKTDHLYSIFKFQSLTSTRSAKQTRD